MKQRSEVLLRLYRSRDRPNRPDMSWRKAKSQNGNFRHHAARIPLDSFTDQALRDHGRRR
ncbi:hypothetical protein AGR3A_Cc20213 [Agrobacterium tomkonis CFBP 6623]|uniref:Uncharacterized protein n=1 Tax=Agrobacterium tomkonis CFBP 6623 TaxID=1183432 RepID=A0A1S7P6V7_9HYPH|nr:hypothetical protein AGR3A_Cc20213 [Agrobacterium tomkonis CFBP 6623]